MPKGPYPHSSNKPCNECNAEICYRWYKGPICANCYKRRAYKENPEKIKSSIYMWRKKASDKVLKIRKRSYEKNKETHVKSVRKWQQANPEKVREYQKKSIEKPEQKKRRKAISDKHYKEKKYLYRAKDAKRRAVKLRATPKWADLEAIKEFYKNCPPGYEVDHIIPLQGENVCGLHVLNNLQYLTPAENRSKGNKYA